MTEKTKKFLMIFGFIGVVILIAFLIYVIFFKKPIVEYPGEVVVTEGDDLEFPDVTGDRENNIEYGYGELGTFDNITGRINTELPTVVKGSVDLVREISNVANGDVTRGIVVSKKGNSVPIISGKNLIAFDETDGGFYKVDLKSGDKQLLTENKFKGASNIVWAPTDDVAIIEFPDGTNVSYDFNKNKQYILPKNWYEFSFQKDGETLAFMTDSTNYDDRWLSISNIDGSGFTPLEPLGNNADKVHVMYSPNEQMIALSRTGEAVGMFQQKALLIGLNGENFNDILVEGRGFNPLWTKNGDKIVYDAYNKETEYNPNIWVVNATASNAGSGSKSLNLRTWVSKCGFNSTGVDLYCAVPRELPEGAGMFPDMMDDAEIYDDIYVVNIYTGYKKIVAKPEENVSISKIMISDDNKELYYQDRFTGTIYSIILQK